MIPADVLVAMREALALLALCAVATAVLSWLSGAFAATTGGLVANWLTFPGVVHHELSHALLALVCGAEVTRVVPFKVSHADGRLGYVSYVPRGPRALQGVQRVLSGIAPVPCGLVTTSLLYSLALPSTTGWGRVAVWYLMLSVVLHMDLSPSDWRGAGGGLLAASAVLFLAATAFFLVSRVSLSAVATDVQAALGELPRDLAAAGLGGWAGRGWG